MQSWSLKASWMGVLVMGLLSVHAGDVGPWDRVSETETPATPNLRGFGRVAVASQEWRHPDAGPVGVTRFRCSRPRQAAVVAGKFLADVDLSAGTERLRDGGRRTASGAVFLTCVQGSETRIVAAPSAQAMASFAAAFPVVVAGAVSEAPYPHFLDRFDRWGWGCYGMGGFNNFHDWMTRADGERTFKDPTEDVSFMVEHGYRFEPWLDPVGFDHSDGLVKNTGVEWMIRLLEAAGMPFSFRVYGAAGGADWTARRFPEYLEQPADFLMSGWHGATLYNKAQPHLTWYDRDIHRYLAVRTMDLMKPYAEHPLNMGWMHPHGELEHDAWFDRHDDYSPTARANWRSFLRAERRSLADVSRLYGRADRPFGDWDQVPIPEFATFAGLDGLIQDLRGTWFWRQGRGKDDPQGTVCPGVAGRWYAQPLDTDQWQPMEMPGADAALDVIGKQTSPWVTTWFRREFTLTPAQLARQPVYLYAFPISHGGIHSGEQARYHGVFINGEKAGAVGVWGALDVTGLVRPGRNDVAVQLWGGVWNGRIFLSNEAPAVYPYLGPDRNRLFILWQDWHIEAKYQAWDDILDGMRQVDGDRPVKFMAPIKFGADRWLKLASEWGGFGHFTGEGMWFFPWYKRYGFLYGLPGSSELAGPAETIPDMFNGFRRTFLAGLNAHDPVFQAQTYTRHPELRQWWIDHRPVLKRMGTYDIDPKTAPQVLIYRSTFNTVGLFAPTPYPELGERTRLIQSPWNWDIGRGTLQTLGHSYLYLDDGGLTDGKMVGFPLMVDGGNESMPAASVQAIRDWVEAGGTFVSLPFSGRNTRLEPDVWPITGLTGCTVARLRSPGEGRVIFKTDQTVFRELAGQSFPDAGQSVDWVGNNLSILSTELATGPDSDVLATFENGAPAIVQRRLGRGRVIALGTTFWRDSRDVRGLWWPGELETRFMADLLAGVGFEPPVCSTDDRRVWAQPYRGNNGLNAVAVLVSWHEEPSGAATGKNVEVTLTLRTQHRPERLTSYGVDGLAELDFVWTNGVAVARVAMPAREVKVIEAAVHDPRAAVAHWWRYQQTMWHELRRPSIDFAPYREGKWLDPTLDLRGLGAEFSVGGDSWTSCPMSVLNFWGAPPATPVVLRQCFELPDRWEAAGGRVFLVSGAWAGPHYQGRARLTLNGDMLHDFPGRNYQEFDVTRLLTAGGNELRLEFDGSEKYQGVVGNLYLYHWTPPDRRVSLAGVWDAESGDGQPVVVTLPGTANAWGPTRRIFVPAEWEHRFQVRLYMEGGAHDAVGAVVNGRLARRHHHWFGDRGDLDITRFLRFGEDNEFRLHHAQGGGANGLGIYGKTGRVPSWNLRCVELHLRAAPAVP